GVLDEYDVHDFSSLRSTAEYLRERSELLHASGGSTSKAEGQMTPASSFLADHPRCAQRAKKCRPSHTHPATMPTRPDRVHIIALTAAPSAGIREPGRRLRTSTP